MFPFNFLAARLRIAHGTQGFKIGRLHIKADRWPWQGYGWFPHKSGNSWTFAPLNSRGSRFGGGWDYKLGISIGGSTVYVDLLFGSLRIWWEGK